MCRRLDSSQSSGSPVTCFKPVTNVTSLHQDPALESNTLDFMDGLFVLFFFSSFFVVAFSLLKACWSAQRSAMSGTVLLFNGRISPVSLCGMRMNFDDMYF